MRWVLGVPQSPSVAGRYGADSAFCAVLVTLQSSIPCSVVEIENISSLKVVVDNFRVAQGSPSDCLNLGDNSEFFLNTIIVFKLFIPALVPLQSPTAGPSWEHRRARWICGLTRGFSKT